MDIKRDLEEKIFDMEKVAKAFEVEPFDIFLLGGSACILGEYSDRVTRDFDFIDLDYPAEYGRVFSMLRDFDMLEYESTLVSPKFKERSVKVDKFSYINIYLLSPEDIIVSKIIRLEEKDLQDIDELIKISDKSLINEIISEVVERKDLYRAKLSGFLNNLPKFRERFDV
jgi:hypothetical protein